MYAIVDRNGRYYAGTTRGGVTIWRMKPHDAAVYGSVFEAERAAAELRRAERMTCRVRKVRGGRGDAQPALFEEAAP